MNLNTIGSPAVSLQNNNIGSKGKAKQAPCKTVNTKAIAAPCAKQLPAPCAKQLPAPCAKQMAPVCDKVVQAPVQQAPVQQGPCLQAPIMCDNAAVVSFAGAALQPCAPGNIELFLPSTSVQVRDSDYFVPVAGALPQRHFGIHPGAVSVNGRSNVVIQPSVSVAPDIIDISPVSYIDNRETVTVSQAQLVCAAPACAPVQQAPVCQAPIQQAPIKALPVQGKI